jgi:hypothetical protein
MGTKSTAFYRSDIKRILISSSIEPYDYSNKATIASFLMVE